MSEDSSNTDPVYVPEDGTDFVPPGYDIDAVDAATEQADAPDGSHPDENLTDFRIEQGEGLTDNA